MTQHLPGPLERLAGTDQQRMEVTGLQRTRDREFQPFGARFGKASGSVGHERAQAVENLGAGGPDEQGDFDFLSPVGDLGQAWWQASGKGVQRGLPATERRDEGQRVLPAQHPYIDDDHSFRGEQGAIDLRSRARLHQVVGQKSLEAIETPRAAHIKDRAFRPGQHGASSNAIQLSLIEGQVELSHWTRGGLQVASKKVLPYGIGACQAVGPVRCREHGAADLSRPGCRSPAKSPPESSPLPAGTQGGQAP